MSSILEDRVSIIVSFGVGTGVGSVIGVRGWPLFGVSAVGAVVGFVAGALLANMRKNEIAETWKKLRKCNHELADCVNVVERCKEVLKGLVRLLSELEQSFHRL